MVVKWSHFSLSFTAIVIVFVFFCKVVFRIVILSRGTGIKMRILHLPFQFLCNGTTSINIKSIVFIHTNYTYILRHNYKVRTLKMNLQIPRYINTLAFQAVNYFHSVANRPATNTNNIIIAKYIVIVTFHQLTFCFWMLITFLKNW